MTEVFVEQRLALPGSAKKAKGNQRTARQAKSGALSSRACATVQAPVICQTLHQSCLHLSAPNHFLMMLFTGVHIGNNHSNTPSIGPDLRIKEQEH